MRNGCPAPRTRTAPLGCAARPPLQFLSRGRAKEQTPQNKPFNVLLHSSWSACVSARERHATRDGCVLRLGPRQLAPENSSANLRKFSRRQTSTVYLPSVVSAVTTPETRFLRCSALRLDGKQIHGRHTRPLQDALRGIHDAPVLSTAGHCETKRQALLHCAN